MSDGMGREFMYLSSHATNRYFIPNWGKERKEEKKKERMKEKKPKGLNSKNNEFSPFGLSISKGYSL